MTRDELLAIGFKEFIPQTKNDLWDVAYQKRVWDDKGIRFFVNVRFWKHSRYGKGIPDGWDATAQFNTRGQPTTERPTFNVELFVRGQTAMEVVGWFDRLWSLMRCDYYEREDRDGGMAIQDRVERSPAEDG